MNALEGDFATVGKETPCMGVKGGSFTVRKGPPRVRVMAGLT